MILEKERSAVLIGSLCVVSEVSSSLTILTLLLLELAWGDSEFQTAALSQGLGKESKQNALNVMAVLCVIDLFALTVSNIILRTRHKKSLDARIKKQLPELEEGERRKSVQIELLTSELEHGRWRYEFWLSNWPYFAGVSYSTFGLCAALGCIFISTKGCRSNCVECFLEADCQIRDVCSWDLNVGGCFQLPDCQANCQDCIDEASCKVAGEGTCTWYPTNNTCSYSWCDEICRFCLIPEDCEGSAAECFWTGASCKGVSENQAGDFTLICDDSYCESQGNDCTAGRCVETRNKATTSIDLPRSHSHPLPPFNSARHRLEEKNCRGGLEAVFFGEDWQFACVDESTKTTYKSCH